jgi:uncharacterized protein
MPDQAERRKPDPNESVTVVFKRRAKPGRERDLESWIADMSKEAIHFEGHMGQNVIRPVTPDDPVYVIILHFDTYQNLQRFMDSELRARWLEKVGHITEGEVEIEHVPGMDYWFDLASHTGRAQPPKWKMALVIFVVLTPVAITLGSLSGWLLGDLHRHIRQIITLFVTVALMTWVIMPPVTSLLRRWLFRH